MVEVYGVNIEGGLEDSEFQRLLEKISTEKRSKVLRRRKRMDARGILVSDILIRSLLIKRYGLKNEQIKFEYNQNLKPRIPQLSDFHFSVSHSGQWVLTAAGASPLGADIERVAPSADLLDLAMKYFRWTEYEFLVSKPEDEIVDRFFELWTLKESFVKAIGEGLRVPLDSFALNMEDSSNIHLMDETKSRFWRFKQYEFPGGYKAAVCSEDFDFPDRATILSLDSVIDDFKRQTCEKSPV